MIITSSLHGHMTRMASLVRPIVGVVTLAASTLLWGSPLIAGKAGAPLKHRYTGLNLAGGEFKAKAPPAIYGRDYIYPDVVTAAPFVAAGMNAVRLPFRWERLQPEPLQPLDPTELKRLDESVSAMSGFELIILDPHNYGSYKHAKLGTPDAPSRLLIDFWKRLSLHYRANRRVAFGLMNEPNGVSGSLWENIAQDCVLAIRATGARNLILVPGSNWTGAHSWGSGGVHSNADTMGRLRDPGDNMAFEMHEYLDARSNGQGGPCVSPEEIAARLALPTEWLRAHHARGFLGEFGAPATPDCLRSLGAIVQTLDDGRDVWLGWTYWAGGSRWHNYPFSIQPDASGPKPQMKTIEPFLAL